MIHQEVHLSTCLGSMLDKMNIESLPDTDLTTKINNVWVKQGYGLEL